MQEIEVSLSQNSQDIGVDTLQSTTQNIGVEIAGESTGIEVLHDDTLKGKGQRSAPLGIADSVLENIDSKVSDVKVNNESVVENTVANISVGTATITIQKNNQNIDSFSLQDTSNKSINISVPTKTSDINNDSDYQTGTEVDNAISAHNTSNDAHSNLLSPMSQNIANNSDAISAETLRATGIEDGLQNQITANSNNITTINGKIPEQASSSNQLADKNFVNSSVATNTANFIGTFNSVADLEAYSGTLTNNDYAFVVGTDSAGNTVYNRYKYTTATTPASWVFEYALNNSSFTAAQWAAINSGATTTNINSIADKVEKTNFSNKIYGTDTSANQVVISYAASNTASTIAYRTTAGQLSVNATPTSDTHAASKKYVDTGLATKITNNATDSTSISILGTGTSVARAINIGSSSSASGTNGVAIGASATASTNSVSVGRSANASSNSVALGREALASGTYSIALGTTSTSSANNAIQIGYGTNNSANTLNVGFYDANDPTNWQLLDGTTGLIPDARISTNLARTSSLATVATTGSYTDLSNTPTIPTVNNATITITQGGVTKGSFTLNQASGDTIALDSGGSDFDELTPSEVEALWENSATLTLTPTFLGAYSGYIITNYTVKDQNNNVLFQSDGTMGTQAITYNYSDSSIVISNLISGNPTSTGIGVLGYSATGCTVTPHASSYSGYYDYITLSNFTSTTPSIEVWWSYGKVD